MVVLVFESSKSRREVPQQCPAASKVPLFFTVALRRFRAKQKKKYCARSCRCLHPPFHRPSSSDSVRFPRARGERLHPPHRAEHARFFRAEIEPMLTGLGARIARVRATV